MDYLYSTDDELHTVSMSMALTVESSDAALFFRLRELVGAPSVFCTKSKYIAVSFIEEVSGFKLH